jgi:hypothetical protein
MCREHEETATIISVEEKWLDWYIAIGACVWTYGRDYLAMCCGLHDETMHSFIVVILVKLASMRLFDP